MLNKLDNATWEEYINNFNALEGSITVKDFCTKNQISKTQFYYHKKRLEKSNGISTIFHAVPIKSTRTYHQAEDISNLKEVKITIGPALIAIPASESALIYSIIRELAIKC